MTVLESRAGKLTVELLLPYKDGDIAARHKLRERVHNLMFGENSRGPLRTRARPRGGSGSLTSRHIAKSIRELERLNLVQRVGEEEIVILQAGGLAKLHQALVSKTRA